MSSPEPVAPLNLDLLPPDIIEAIAHWVADARLERLAREAAQQPTPPANGQPAASEAA